MAGPMLRIVTGIGDAIHGARSHLAERGGMVPTVVPFVGYGGDGWVRVLGRVLLRKPGGPPAAGYVGGRGWRSFAPIPVPDVAVTVVAGNRTTTIRSDRGGIIDARVDSTLAPGWSRVTVSLAEGASVDLPVFVVDSSAEFGLVSDVDDTVMVTLLPRPFLAAWNSFVLDEHARTPVAGMAVLYERLVQAHPGAPVVYLSTGAWNVVPTLTRFLTRNLYPRGALLLTDWGPSPDHWFRNGAKHKSASLDRLADEFPHVRWLLIGDDGQADERIYGDFASRRPESVCAVAIRQLTPGQAVLAGGRMPAREHRADAVPWVYAPDGAGLSTQLRDLGIL